MADDCFTDECCEELNGPAPLPPVCEEPCTPCESIIPSECVMYNGTPLECIGAETGTPLQEVLQTIDERMCVLVGSTEVVAGDNTVVSSETVGSVTIYTVTTTVAEGPQGLQGEPGLPGEQGEQGEPGNCEDCDPVMVEGMICDEVEIYSEGTKVTEALQATADFFCGRVTEQNNFVRNIVITEDQLDGVGTEVEQIARYVNDLGFVVADTDSKVNVILREPAPNFDVTADWNLTTPAPVTDETSFRNFLNNGNNDLTNIQIVNFSLIGGQLKCYLLADGTTLDISNLDLSRIDLLNRVNGLETVNTSYNIGAEAYSLPSGIKSLLSSNIGAGFFIFVFELPITLVAIDFSYNQMTLSGYTSSEAYWTAHPPFTNPCTIRFDGNPDSITGTNLEAILLNKNVIIIP